jgi:hypothetical protein
VGKIGIKQIIKSGSEISNTNKSEETEWLCMCVSAHAYICLSGKVADLIQCRAIEGNILVNFLL